MLFPLRVEGAEVDRVPYVSLSIAAVCALFFIATWVVPANPAGAPRSEAFAIAEEALEHHLRLPEHFVATHLGRQAEAAFERERATAPVDKEPTEEQVALQRRLDARVSAFVSAAEHSLLRRLSLVPARGPAQIGWLTHMFLHWGWLHLLGNLFFFYLTGLLLEDAWGRPLFAGFYFLCGLVAAAAQFASAPHETTMMLGASGAIAGTMGAFSFRFASRKIRMGYFFLFRLARGTFLIPAWLWGGLWFAGQLVDLFFGQQDGVAVMAHVGGFAFGFAVAFGLEVSGIEARHVAPAIEQKVAWTQHPKLQEAFEALARGDAAQAEALVRAVLVDQPLNDEAGLLLSRVLLQSGRAAEAAPVLERVFTRLVAKPVELLVHAVEELGPALDEIRLRPQLAGRIAAALEQGPEGFRPHCERLYLAAGAAGGLPGAKALLRAGELALDRADPAAARAHLEQARALAGVPPELTCRLDALAARIAERGVEKQFVRARELDLDEPGAAGPELESAADALLAQAPAPVALAEPSGQPPRVTECRVLDLNADRLTLQRGDGRSLALQLKDVVAVGVGVTAEQRAPTEPSRAVAVADVIASWGDAGAGPVVYRLKSSSMGLSTLYPAMDPKEAFAEFLRSVLDQSGATPLPERAAIASGGYRRFATLAELETELYGQPPAP